MKRKLIIDGNAVYEIDEECMLKKRLSQESEKKHQQTQDNQNRSSQADS